MSAAAGEQENGNDDDPDAVVVKQIAEAVVHNRSSLKGRGRCLLPFCYQYMRAHRKGARFLSVARKKMRMRAAGVCGGRIFKSFFQNSMDKCASFVL
jgi:hypothetical protein